jgi:hypothetical protein
MLLTAQQIEAIFSEARNRILKGEAPSLVSAWMKSQGADPQLIDALLLACQQERADLFRGRAIVELILASVVLVIAVSILLFVWATNFDTRRQTMAGLGYILGVYGMYRLIRGLIYLFRSIM